MEASLCAPSCPAEWSKGPEHSSWSMLDRTLSLGAREAELSELRQLELLWMGWAHLVPETLHQFMWGIEYPLLASVSTPDHL